MQNGKIFIGVKWIDRPNALNIYIGRGSPLGNPWAINAHQSRDVVCDLYDAYLNQAVSVGNKKIIAVLERIEFALRLGEDVNLQCFCQGKRCHGESIRALVEKKIQS